MANLLDYVKWRGDIPFSVSPFCEIDALILCQISYMNFDGIVPAKGERTVIRAEAAVDSFFSLMDIAARSYRGVLINPHTTDLFRAAFTSRRFRDVGMFAYENATDVENTKQFAAISFLLPDKSKTVFCAFRGTDDTIVGWKEDFTMAFLPVIPAQQAAADYVRFVSERKPGRRKRLILGGHSKGGNLAVFAAASCPGTVRKTIASVYNFDGPGFSKDKLESPCFREIENRVFSYTPEVSVVGMLFEHSGKFEIVASSEKGLMQHDAFSWRLDGPRFQLVEDTSSSSKFFDKAVKKLLEETDEQKRRLLVDYVFGVIESSNARTLTDLRNGGFETSKAILSAMLKKIPDLKIDVFGKAKTAFKSLNG